MTHIRHIPAVLLLAAATACTAPAEPAQPPAVPAEADDNAMDDVTIKKCRVGTAAGTSDMWQVDVSVRIKNAGDEARTYEVAVEAVRGEERIATVHAFAENLKPGQKTMAKGLELLDNKPAGKAQCRLLSVTAR